MSSHKIDNLEYTFSFISIFIISMGGLFKFDKRFSIAACVQSSNQDHLHTPLTSDFTTTFLTPRAATRVQHKNSIEPSTKIECIQSNSRIACKQSFLRASVFAVISYRMFYTGLT